MNIKIDASYFTLKSKPSLLHSLTLVNKSQHIKQKQNQLNWDFKFLQEISTINQKLQTINTNIKQTVNKIQLQPQQLKESTQQVSNKIIQILTQLKSFLLKCQYFNISLTTNEILDINLGLPNFYKYPQNFKICTLLTEIQRSIKAIENDKDFHQIEKMCPYIGILHKIAVNQIIPILKCLKQNLYIPCDQLFIQLLQKLHFTYDNNLSLKENFKRNKYDFNDNQTYSIYYQLLIYKECSSLQGLSFFLSYAKNILLDRKSGALAADHQTWVAIFETCLKIYSRNSQVRLNNWLQIDQILSTSFCDEQFSIFLMTQNVQNFSLASLNFYLKNLNKSDQQRLLKVAQLKIQSLFQCGLAWKQAQDIVQHLDNECQNESKQKIYNKVIKLIDGIFLSKDNQKMAKQDLIEIQIGLTFFIESMCKNLQVTHKIFNKTNMKLISETLKKSQQNDNQIRLLYHIFTQFIINSYEQSDELASYLEQNQQIITIILPQIMTLFNAKNYSLPKQLYKLIFHSVENIQQLPAKIWRGIGQLYFIQSFEQTIDMQIFHSQNEAKRRIADQVVQILKQLTINNAKQHILLQQILKQPKQNHNGLQQFLQFKSFKDQTIFNNILMMSTFFGQYLSLIQLTSILSQFYTPLVPYIKWKSSQNQSLTLLSFVSQQLPIDVLKATYKFLKQGLTINLQNLQSLSTQFWNLYFSNQNQSKANAILQQSSFTFQQYQNLHSLRMLDLILNMINCVFDKLNQHSQKSIKQLKIMYQWGVQYIEKLQPHIYPILINCLVNQFESHSKILNNQNIQTFQLYSRTKNISALDLHLCQKYHIFQTFNDFNKIGKTIEHQKTSQISLLMYPCFIKKSKQLSCLQTKNIEEKQFLGMIIRLFVLIENSCLQQIMSDDHLNQVSKKNIENEKYYQRAILMLQQFKSIITQDQTSTNFIAKFMQKSLYKRLISHLKLLMGKIYIPFMIKRAFEMNQMHDILQSNNKKLKQLDNKFQIIKLSVQIIHKFDTSFQQHFAQLMQVIQQNSQNQSKNKLTQLDKQKYNILPQILIKTLQMFIKCVLSNIKVRSFHIFKLIKLYLNQTNTEVQKINQVIKFYIDLLYNQFILQQNYSCLNQEIKYKSYISKNNNQSSRLKILTPQKIKDHPSFTDKILSPLKKQKISLEQLKFKKYMKSSLTPLKDKQNIKINDCLNTPNNQHQTSFINQDQISPQFAKLIIKQHNLNTVQCSCTLSMFINLFARLNYSSLPAGVQLILSKQNDKLIYIDYLMQLTQRLLNKQNLSDITQRDMEILSIDVYGNLTCILKGKVNQDIFKRFIQLSKMTLRLKLNDQTIITLPIKLLNQRVLTKHSAKKFGSNDTNLNELTQISKFMAEFQQQPLAYELSIKSHIMKITPYIKSNIHICNLQYIVGQNKSSISKKIIQTNYKLIQNIMGKHLARQFIKKYQKLNIKKQTLSIQVSIQAINQLDSILFKFSQLYQKINTKSQQNIVLLYFYFKKICSLLFYAPQLFTHILTKKITMNYNEMTFIDIMLDTLKHTLVFFCQFYIISLKINSGFCSQSQFASIMKSTKYLFDDQFDQKIQKLSLKIPLNLVFEVYLKIQLLKMMSQKRKQNLNLLRALNFTIKQSQKFRFRFYKFIRINVLQNEDFLKRIDEQIIQSILKQLRAQEDKINENVPNFINKVEMMDLCLQNLLSHSMFDYAKMKLDDKLKQTFIHSQYSIKCLQSFNCDINTLKVLQQAQQEKSVSSGEAMESQDLEIDNGSESNFDSDIQQVKANENALKNPFDIFEVVQKIKQNYYISQSPKQKVQLQMFNMIEFTSQIDPYSIKQTSQLKQWLNLTIKKSSTNQLTQVLLRQMQKSCQKLIGKQNLSFNFQDPGYLQNPNGDHIDITAFAINDNSNISSDCCMQQTSFIQQHDQGMIIQSEQQFDNQINQSQPLYDEICENEVDHDGIIQQEDQTQQHNQFQDEIKISIVQQTQINRFKNYQNQDGDAIVQMSNQQDDQLLQQELSSGTDGSIQFTSSIKTLDNIDDILLQQVSQQIPIQSVRPSQCPQITINNQPRQYHYTIDNFTTNQPTNNRLTNNNLSLVDTIQPQTIIQSNEPVTKQSIFNLIQQYTLNPQILKVIKLKLKKISNLQLKKVHGITHGDLKQQVQRQMRTRGLFVSLGASQYENANQGSLFSISRFINESFQIDQSKFYAANFKKCDKKTSQKQKIQKIPLLTFTQWVNFVFVYLIKTRYNQCKQKIFTETLLQTKNFQQLLIKLLLNKQNLVLFLEVLLNILSCEKLQQTIKFFQNSIKISKGINDINLIFKNISSLILNDLISKLITNRIGLPVLLKGKWNYENKKLIKYQFQCLVSDSNLNNNRNQGQPLLQIFLRKSIELIYNQQSLSPQQKLQLPQQQSIFIKSLTQYFKNVQNFQSNQYPYYSIQDTIKLSSPQRKTIDNTLSLNYQSKVQYSFTNRSKISLCETLINAMKSSNYQSLHQYQQVFYLMNYLDFQTFSQFLELLIAKNKPLCQKILDKELNILKRFKKSSYTQNMNKDKLAQIYWHMRKSSKKFLSTDQQQKQLQFFAKIISTFSSSIFLKFKQSIFKFGYGKQQNKKKQKISYLNKLLMNPSYENKYKSIKDQISQKQKQYLLWKLTKCTEILKEDVLPIIEKISSSFNECLKKWQLMFEELQDIFGTQRQQKIILFKQCSEFYKIFLSFQMLLQQQEASIIRTMSSLKTKPSLQSTRDMGITGRRRSSLKLPRVSLASSLSLTVTPNIATFKSVFKAISPKFSFFSQMIDESCPQLKIHAKYSTIDSKLKLLHQKSKGAQLVIQVNRENIWQDTLPYLNQTIADKNVKIKIVEELGLDYGGIRREWITLIVKELLNPNLGLFQLSVNGLAFQPSAMSYLVPNHLYHFYKFGILVGKALKENWLLQINFTKSFLKHILGYTLYVQDLQDIDPETTKSLLWILNNDVGDGDLGIDFTHSFQALGKKQTIELIQNGKNILVSQENKKDYVKKLAVHKMTQQIRQQSKAFMNGLQKVVSYETLKLFSYKELGIYLAGMPTVDVQQMKRYTRYQGFTSEDQTVQWFWQTLSKYTEQQKANFLFFLTGSYKVPYGGFKQNPISINKMPASKDYLPVAHTCFSVIDLPEYSSKQKLMHLIDKAITEGKGFSVS